MGVPAAAVFGRESELEAIAAFVAGRDRPGALILEGEPGIGKTTLLRAALDDARARGSRVLSCRPGRRETQLSFAALADLLGEALAEVDGRLPAPQRRALEVALLLDAAAGEAAEGRTVLAATLSVLRALAERGPVLLAIDDLQWLDAPSEEALAFALRRLGRADVSVLAARRVDPAGAEPGALEEALEQRDDAPVRRLRFGPLPPGSIHAVVRRALGDALPQSAVRRIAEVSGGNPFYAMELARAVVRRAEPLGHGESVPVPDSLQSAVGAHLDALSAPAQEVSTVVAALAEPTLVLVRAAGAEAGLDEAIRAGVLEEDARGRLRFTHPLLASAAYGRLPSAARRSLHARLADLVEGEERARHLALGATGPEETVADTLEEAAGHAAGRGAIGAAAELAEEAIRLTPPRLADALRARHVAAARYEIRHGDTGHARAHLEPLLAQLPAGPARAGVLLQLARLAEHETVSALRLCHQAIAEAGPADVRAAEANQLAAEMAMLSGDIPAAIAHARMACEVAERAGAHGLLVESLGTLCHYQTYSGAIEPGLLERAVELEARQARPSNNYSPREILGLRLMYADRLDEARELLEASYRTAVELGDELDRGSLLIHLTQLECRAGRLAAADRNARECTISREQAGWGLPGARFATALVAAHLGRVDEARAAAEDGAAVAARGGNEVFRVLNRWAAGFLELSLGDAAAADRLLRGLPEAVQAMGYLHPGVRPLQADAIEAQIGAGDLAVDDLIDDLEARGRDLDLPWALAAARRCRGLLHAARGYPAAAIAEFESALLEHQRSPQRLERGRTLLALGATLRRLKRRREAREALTSALEIFDAIGAPLWAERAASEIARIPGRAAGAGSGDLTETERQVASLVAEGLSNKEVAARLFVTVRTVEANLSAVYAKLGLRSRTELARRSAERTDR